jgi:beta-N-acetylhexosaminidase
MGVAATAKHFPGHGLVSGDTHNKLVTIDGELREVNNYIPLIEQGVLSIMVGHIAVKNNSDYDTHGLPASCSRVIVTDLLKKKMGFRGIVITDAMNMGALRDIEDASFKAVAAGCDMILMEPDESGLINNIYTEYQQSSDFQAQVDQSVKKILRLKYCLNLVQN